MADKKSSVRSPMTGADHMGSTPSRKGGGDPGVYDHNPVAPFTKPHDVGKDGINERFFETGPYTMKRESKAKVDSPMTADERMKIKRKV